MLENPPDEHVGEKPLSTRESQVLARFIQGSTSSEIARELQVSTTTIETYRSRIYEKLGLHSRMEMMRYAANIRIQKNVCDL